MHLRGRQRVFAAFPQHRAVTADLHSPLLARPQTVPALVFWVEHLGGQSQTISPRLPVPVFNEGPQARIQSHANIVAPRCMREKAFALAECRESRIRVLTQRPVDGVTVSPAARTRRIWRSGRKSV